MKDLTLLFTTYLVPAGVFLAACAYVYTQIRTGGSRASSEVIATYREQVSQLKEELTAQAKNHSDQMTAMADRHSKEMNTLTDKVGVLTGLVTAKDAQIKELKDLLLEKSPEMVEFYKTGNSYFKEAAPILQEIKHHLQVAKV